MGVTSNSEQSSRIVFILIDGLSDVSVSNLGDKTPLESAETPVMDKLARCGVNGLLDPVEPGLACGSDTAHLSIFGYPPRKYYRGRGAFETMGAGLDMDVGDIAFKSNFATIDLASNIVLKRRADREFEVEGPILCDFLNGLKLPSFPQHSVAVKYATEHRCGVRVRGPRLSDVITGTDPLVDNKPLRVCTPSGPDPDGDVEMTCNLINELTQEITKLLQSHPVNQERMKLGKVPANAVLLRGAGKRVQLPSFSRHHRILLPTCTSRPQNNQAAASTLPTACSHVSDRSAHVPDGSAHVPMDSNDFVSPKSPPQTQNLLSPRQSSSASAANNLSGTCPPSSGATPQAAPVSASSHAAGPSSPSSPSPTSPPSRPTHDPPPSSPVYARSFVIAPTCIIKGLAMSVGMDALSVPGATGDYKSDFTVKGLALLDTLAPEWRQHESTVREAPPRVDPTITTTDQDKDTTVSNADNPYYGFGFLHIKAVDDAGHDRDVEMKVNKLQEIDRMLELVVAGLQRASEVTDGRAHFTVVVTGDHSTPVLYGDHSCEPVPFLLTHVDHSWPPQASGKLATDDDRCCRGLVDRVESFSESAAHGGALGRFPGSEVMKLIQRVSTEGSK
eukprot:Rmarinus@m.3414